MKSISPPLSAFGKDSDRRIHVAEWLMRMAVLLFALGLAVALFTRTGSAVGNVALMEWGWNHRDIFLAERISAAVLLLVAVTILLFPTTLALLFLAGVIMVEAIAAYHFGGNPFVEYTPLAHTLRYAMPLALIPLVFSRRWIPSMRWRLPAACWILRIGIAVVFVIHGLEALWLHPQFLDLIIGSAEQVFGVRVSESQAGILLRIIGVVDLLVALLLLIRPWPVLLGWICFWGLITALSRPLSLGFGSYPEVLLRSSHILAPIALGLLWSAWKRTQRSRKTASPTAPIEGKSTSSPNPG